MSIRPITLAEFEKLEGHEMEDACYRIKAALRDREALLAAEYRRLNPKSSTGKRITR